MELIVACTEEGIIGEGGIPMSHSSTKYMPSFLPWHIPEDLRRFKALTLDNIVVMGRKTYDSLPVSPLPNRIHVVISRVDTPIISPNVYVSNESDARSILNYLRELYPDKKVFIVGGGQIYDMFFHDCKAFHITLVSGPIRSLQSPVRFRWLTLLREKKDVYQKIYENGPTLSKNGDFTYTYITYQTEVP